MAGEIPNLITSARSGTGKGAARQARRDTGAWCCLWWRC